jgi:hypothetical protein
MNNWKPHIDLARLLDALGEEIVRATDEEVRQACIRAGCSIPGAAAEVRNLIAAVSGETDEVDPRLALAEIARRREHLARQH